jgi:predicted O-methyltransferase YrrM
MNQETSQGKWSAVDAYFVDRLLPADSVLDEALASSERAGMPAHAVAPNQGKLLQLLVQMANAKRVLELGTLGGYSTIWLARGVGAAGSVVTVEANPVHAEVARRNFTHAGLSGRIDLRLGQGVAVLEGLLAEGTEPFDFIFIDADKPNNPAYLELSLKLSRPGTVIVGDNVVRDGAVANSASTDANVLGVQRFFDLIAANPRLSATAIQTVGSKGYDGFLLARVLE